MSEFSAAQQKAFREDLFKFFNQSLSSKESDKKMLAYKSTMRSESSVFNRVPLDGGAVLRIESSRSRTTNIVIRMMGLQMYEKVVLLLRKYVEKITFVEIRLQSLLYHIAECPQYDKEIVDIENILTFIEGSLGRLEIKYGRDKPSDQRSSKPETSKSSDPSDQEKRAVTKK